MAGSSKKVIFAALVGNAAIAAMKFFAAAFTGSSAMFSEGIHSVVDTGNQILLLFGLKQAKKPADKRYPFGHGKEVYFWSFVVAILIFAVGAGLSAVKGYEHIVHPQVITDPIWNYVVLSIALIVEGIVFFVAIKEFHKSKGERDYLEAIQQGKDPAMFVVLLEDAAALLGLFVAMLGVALSQLTGNYIYDGVASAVIALILAAIAALLAYETKGLLIGESANEEVVSGIRKLVSESPAVERVNEVLTVHMGPEYILVNLSVDFIDTFHTQEMETAIAKIDKNIKEKFTHVSRIFIEAESWKFTY